MSNPVILFVSALQEEMDPLWSDPRFEWGRAQDCGEAIWCRTCDYKGYTFVAAAACEMGLVVSAIVATKLILRWKPVILIALGICAGRRDLKLADVVVSSASFLYRFGRQVEGTFKPTPRRHDIADKTRELAERFERDWPEVAPQGPNPGERPAVVIGAYASADFLMKDQETMLGLTDSHGEFAALDMESYALMRAATFLEVPYGAIALKAVSDHGNEAKTDEGRARVKTASKEAAVQFAMMLIRSVDGKPDFSQSRAPLRPIAAAGAGERRILAICPHRMTYDAMRKELCDQKETASAALESSPDICSNGDKEKEIFIARMPRGQFGHVDGAIWSTIFIHAVQPHLVLLVGTCGGFRDGGRLGLGTIVFANRVFHFQFGKFEAGNHIPEVRSVEMHDLIRGYLFAQAGEGLDSLIDSFYDDYPPSTEGKPPSRPHWRIDPLASSDLFLRDQDKIGKVQQQDRKAIGVEMEGYAVMRSASHASVPLGTLVVRSVADHADPTDEASPRYADFARHLSAKVAAHLLGNGLFGSGAAARTRSRSVSPLVLTIRRTAILILRRRSQMGLHQRHRVFADHHAQQPDQCDDRRRRRAHPAQPVHHADDSAHRQRNHECIHGKLRDTALAGFMLSGSMLLPISPAILSLLSRQNHLAARRGHEFESKFNSRRKVAGFTR